MQYHSQETQYYLPLQYDDDKIVLLVRDPYWLFAYWEISESKRNNFINQFGQNMWHKSRPTIKLSNLTLGYIKYIEIDDFANSWYINAESPDCTYTAELGRLVQGDFFISMAISNSAHTPSDNQSPNTYLSFINFNDLKKMNKQFINIDFGRYNYVKDHNSVGLSSIELSGISSESFIR